MLTALSGCMLPNLVFDNQTTTPAAYSPASTTTAVSPINPTFTMPTASAGNTSLVLPNLADIIAKVKPSVVAITVQVPTTSFFGSTVNQEGAGSGWIIDPSGLIVTNNHVVDGASSITVTLEDGRSFDASSVKTDSVSDLAVLRIGAQNLPAVTVGDSSKLRVGDWVIAIGNSLGQGIGATKGIVSALGVSVTSDSGETLDNLIQTDAAINPGNSGGPLINLDGQVIGINSIKVSQVGVEGMGYAISSQTAMPIINSLITTGYVSRPWLGVQLYTVDSYAIRQLKLKVDQGVLLTTVVSGGPSDKAGLKQYDVITNFGGKDVTTVEGLVQLVRSHKVGDTVAVTYWRGSTKSTLNVTLEQSPPSSP